MLLLACLSGVSTLLIILAVGLGVCERSLRYNTIALGTSPEKGSLINLAPLFNYYNEKIFQAGLQMTSTIFIWLQVIVVLLSFTAGAYLIEEHRLIAGMLLAVLSCLVMHKGIDMKISKRKRRMESQMADVIILLSNSLRSGLSLLQGLELAANEMRAPISGEFRRVLKEINFGISLEDALFNMNRRVQNPEFELVVTAIHVHMSLGGNLSAILDKVAAIMYDRIAIRDELKTLTVQGRMSGWVIGILPIFSAAIIYGLNPKYLHDLFYDDLAKRLLMGAFILELIGIFVIRRITSLKI